MILHCTGPSRCNLPMVVGPCDAVVPSWFYNSTSGDCERFNYGGCEGNDNRFSNLRVCQAVCNDDSKAHLHVLPDIKDIYIHLPSLHHHKQTHTPFTGCPGVPTVSCFADPCDSEDCDVDGAECVANYCGSCNAVWLVGDREVCQEGMLNYVVCALFRAWGAHFFYGQSIGFHCLVHTTCYSEVTRVSNFN